MLSAHTTDTRVPHGDSPSFSIADSAVDAAHRLAVFAQIRDINTLPLPRLDADPS